MSEHIVTHRKEDLVMLLAAVSEALQFNTSFCLFTSHRRNGKMLHQPGAKSCWHWFQCSSFMWGGCGDLVAKAAWQTLKTWVQTCNIDTIVPLPFPCHWPECKRIPGCSGWVCGCLDGACDISLCIFGFWNLSMFPDGLSGLCQTFDSHVVQCVFLELLHSLV